MKKLSKLSLLGEMDLLSKAELKQLVGAESSDGCRSPDGTCNIGHECTTDPEGQSGFCGINEGTNNCECLVGTKIPSMSYYY